MSLPLNSPAMVSRGKSRRRRASQLQQGQNETRLPPAPSAKDSAETQLLPAGLRRMMALKAAATGMSVARRGSDQERSAMGCEPTHVERGRNVKRAGAVLGCCRARSSKLEITYYYCVVNYDSGFAAYHHLVFRINVGSMASRCSTPAQLGIEGAY